MLLPILVHAEAFKCQVAAWPEMRLHGSRQENGRFHGQIGHSVLHYRELHSDDTCHFDGAAKGNLAVALREVEIADAEFGSRDVDGEVGFAASAEVLDVAVASVLGSAWHCPGAFSSDFGLDPVCCAACMHTLRLGGEGHGTFKGRRADQFCLSAVPLVKHLLGWRATKDARMNEAGKANARNVAR